MLNTPQKTRLLELLNKNNASNTLISVSIVWNTFKDYGREIFEQKGVGLLFQVGIYNFTEKEMFYFDPVCQFEIFDEQGQHDYFEQLHCELSCLPNKDLSGIKTNLWSFDYPTADAFFAAVEALPEFEAAIKQSGYNLSVIHEEV